MTDTPAEVAEALTRVDFDCPSAGLTLRDYIADLERQLAEAREVAHRRLQQVRLLLGEIDAHDWLEVDADEVERIALQWREKYVDRVRDIEAQLAAQRERDGRLCELIRRAWSLLDIECPNHPLVDELQAAAMKDTP
jgi:hypothetical protein